MRFGPSHSWDMLSFCWLRCNAQAFPGHGHTCLNSSPAGEMPSALTCSVGTFAFSEVASGSDPQPHTCPFLARKRKGRRHYARCRIKVFQPPRPHKGCTSFSLSLGTSRITHVSSGCTTPETETVRRCLGGDFAVGSCSPPPGGVPGESAEPPASCCQGSVPGYPRGEGEQGQMLGPPHRRGMLWAEWGALGKHLEGPRWPLQPGGQ